MVSQRVLERAALYTLCQLRETHLFDEAKIAVIGGMAYNHYMAIDKRRPTEDVDFVIETVCPLPRAREGIRRLPGTRFWYGPNGLVFQGEDGISARVDIIASKELLEVPAKLMRLRDIPDSTIPYIDLESLIVMKMRACGIVRDEKGTQHARDAEALVEQGAISSPSLILSQAQKELAMKSLDDVAKLGTRNERWWREKLGL